MKLAILDGWPNLIENAEKEFIERFRIACRNVGVECSVAVTSDDVEDISPDAVLVTHEYSRKLTKYPTLGILWSPLTFFQNDEYRLKSIKSYDGYVVGNAELRRFAGDIQFGFGVRKPIADEFFLPTSYTTERFALEEVDAPTVSYMGVHWDGARHKGVFDTLARSGLVRFYGPEESWRHIGEAYGGKLPFDGRSVIDTLATHGLSLCMHRKEHRQQNTPSMRIFEALSVGALPICDEIEFAKTHLKDIALFIDTSKSPAAIEKQVAELYEWTLTNKDEAISRARAGKAWFDEYWSLEAKLKNLIIPFVDRVRAEGKFKVSYKSKSSAARKAENAAVRKPDCEVIIRVGGRDLPYLRRSIGSVIAANSEETSLSAIVVDYKGRQDIRAFVDEEIQPYLPVKYMTCENTGFRSTALWTGLQAATAEFVSHLDDDDAVFPNHYRQLHLTLKANRDRSVAYSGVIKVEDEPGHYVKAANFHGPKGQLIKERRSLQFLDSFDLHRMVRFDNFIQSNSWMARTAAVHEVMGEDPCLEVVEDVYLYLLLLSRGSFAFTGSPTSTWHWRSTAADNSMLSVDQSIWGTSVNRIARRLENLQFRAESSYKTLAAISASMVGGETDAKVPGKIAEVDFNDEVDGGSAIADHARLTGFHMPETGGVWSRQPEAVMEVTLGPNVAGEGGVLLLEAMCAYGGGSGRSMKLAIPDVGEHSVPVRDWSIVPLRFDLKAGIKRNLKIELCAPEVVKVNSDSGEDRALGIYIKSMRVVRSEEEVNALTVSKSVAAVQASETELQPHVVYYEEGSYSHLEYAFMSHLASPTKIKLQKNGEQYSLQVDIDSLLASEAFDQQFVEIDKMPVVRVYFNNNIEDMSSRFHALPPRVQSLIGALKEESYDQLIKDNLEAFEDRAKDLHLQAVEMIKSASELGIVP